MAPTVDIVTLDDFASKMPSWAPDLPNHLYALVDMGSNGIRFSISDLSPPCSRLLKCLYRERAAISLFDALNESSSSGSPAFSSDIIARVSQTLARFKLIADEFGVSPEHISVFATEAMRKASNAVVMLDAIRSESGLGVHILAPEVETLFGAMGARSGFTTVNGLFLDLGGGSVQMTYMNSATRDYAAQAARTGKSLPFGAARLINVLENSNTEVRAAALDELQVGMHGAFARLQQEFPLLRDTQLELDGSGIDIYLCGGGFRGYGSILMHNDAIHPYPIPTVGAYTVKGSFFKQTATMRKTNAEYNDKIFGMSQRRRKQFPAIATVVEALIGAVPRIRTVTFCSGGNREGVLLLKLPASIREASPLPLLHCGNNTRPVDLEAVTRMLQSALPSNIEHSNVPTVLSLGLGPLFASEIWSRTGEPSEANASFQLHQSLARDPSVPGFTHLARSVLGLTLCSRWGATLGPIDQQLFKSLQKIVHQASPEAMFWAEYIGEVAQLLSKLCPRAPETSEQLESTVGYSAKITNGKIKTKLQLTVTLSPAMYQILDHQEISNSFKNVGKWQDNAQKPCDKVEVLVQMM
ncbi:Ppx/GppA phosphatase family-domain-containing protein [Xylariaceae sp. AK1471]|nr:Ppx/GppA phosphatase family-domain-containing protein [Xylariaceae sp. AK1471]